MKRAFSILTLILAGAGCAPSPPNVVVIIIDDLGWADTGVYGSTFYKTPHIDRLASEALRFSQFYAASSVCSPTRASIMTGKHPARLDLTNWIGGEQNGVLRQAEYVRQLPLSEETLGEAFAAAGYDTGYIGKWHLGQTGFLPDAQGFDDVFAVNEAGQPGAYFPPYENPNWPITNVPDLAGDEPGTYLTDRLTEAATSFIDSHMEGPFLLVLSHYAVHTPLQAPDSLVQVYRARALALGPETEDDFQDEHGASTKLRQDHPTYAGMIERVDESVGRVMTALRETGLEDNTIVVFLSDNGGLSTLTRRSESQATSNRPLRSGKGWLYDGGIRSPLLIRTPDGRGAGGIVSTPSQTVDIYPTLLDLAGLPKKPGQHQDGRSLAPAVNEAQSLAHTPLYWHFPHYHGSGNKPGGAIREGNLKLIEWFEDGSTELYDLSVDVGEQMDLVAERPQDAERLLEMLRTWREEVGANMPTRVDDQ
jgi:arylsulfatase A-like enzyme